MPPTDPRIMALTDEQIMVEYAHLELDRKESGGGDVFTDDDYDDYDSKSEARDSRLSDDDDWEDIPPSEAVSLDFDPTEGIKYEEVDE